MSSNDTFGQLLGRPSETESGRLAVLCDALRGIETTCHTVGYKRVKIFDTVVSTSFT